MNAVLFLCTGNYYRSRFAEHYFNWLAEGNALRWRALSRGLAVGTAGNIGPMSRSAVDGLRARGIVLNGNLRFPQQVSQSDLVDADLIVAMKEAEHRAMVAAHFPAWADQVEYWHIDDLDCASSEDALPVLEDHVRALAARCGSL